MFTPSTPFALTSLTAWTTVMSACANPAHMFGVLSLKSWRMTMSTTLVPCWWAVETRLLSADEFHTVQPLSPAKWPAVLTWRPKYATVDSRPKFQLGYPTVGSERLLARAKPKTSRLVCAVTAEFWPLSPTLPPKGGGGLSEGAPNLATAGMALPATYRAMPPLPLNHRPWLSAMTVPPGLKPLCCWYGAYVLTAIGMPVLTPVVIHVSVAPYPLTLPLTTMIGSPCPSNPRTLLCAPVRVNHVVVERLLMSSLMIEFVAPWGT